MKSKLTFQTILNLTLSGIVVLCLASCNKETSQDQASTVESTQGLEKVYERGPVKISLHLDQESPTIADKVSLEIKMLSEENYTITPPTFEKTIGKFEILDSTISQPELTTTGALSQTHTYRLEPFLSGEYTIPSMKFAFQDTQTQEVHEIETEEIVLQVRSLITEAKDLALHEIELPVALPKPKKDFTLSFVFLGVIVLLVVLAYFLYKKMPKKEKIEKRIPAHEQALSDLEKLQKNGHPEEGEVKEYYQKISDILRTYIENRFGLQAPEQTTEEFLENLRSSSSFEQDHQSLLKNFLKHCDLVKFAEHTPQEDDIQSTFDSCKSFIIETKEPTV